MKKIVSTGKSPEMPKGTVYTEGDELAKTLVKAGYATYSEEEVAEPVPDKKLGDEITQTKKAKK